MTIDFLDFQLTPEEIAALLVFGLAFIIQLIYMILLIRFIFSNRPKNQETVQPSISVVVTSRNYKDHLKELLPILLSQDYPDYEVVVVDDCSTDGTDWLLAEMKISYGHLKTTRIIQETDFPNALAITIGVRASSKDWMIFLNPLSKIHDKDWLKSYAEKLGPSKEVSIGYMNYREAKGGYKSWIRFENFSAYLLSGAGKAFGVMMPVFEQNIAYRRETFLRLRGFAAVLDSPFSENELFINKIATKKNATIHMCRSTAISFLGETEWIDYTEYKKKQLMLRRKFTSGQRFFRFLSLFSRFLLTASLVVLLILSQFRFWILGIWGFLLLMDMIWIAVATKKLGEKNFLPMILIYRTFLPVMNFFFVVNQIFTGNKRKWK
ncbi:MAG: glycosyltransferase [Marinilabiliales bacterium]|nr:glycosyltransferase [Marinilabiliales bacterium]